MFGIGFFEILMVLIGVLIFVRPKDLPQFVYKIGKIYKEIRLAYEAVINEFNNLADQGRDLVEKNKGEIKNTFSELTVAQSNEPEIKTKKPRLAKVLKDVDNEKENLKKISKTSKKKTKTKVSLKKVAKKKKEV